MKIAIFDGVEPRDVGCGVNFVLVRPEHVYMTSRDVSFQNKCRYISVPEGQNTATFMNGYLQAMKDSSSIVDVLPAIVRKSMEISRVFIYTNNPKQWNKGALTVSHRIMST